MMWSFRLSFLCLLTGGNAPFRFCSSYHHFYYHCCSTQPVSLPGALQQQFVISSSNSGAFSDRVDITDLASLLQKADFQLKLAALSMGGFAMYMPHIIVYPLQLFKTSDSSEFLELGVLIQVLPRVSGFSSMSTASVWCTG